MTAKADLAEVASTDVVPLRGEMFHAPPRVGERARLRGSRCRDCAETFFPHRRYCAACTSGAMDEIELRSSGEVATFTIVHQQLPGSAMVPPYAIVNVRLDEGPTVQTVLRERFEALSIGSRVDLVIEPVLDEDGRTYVSFVASLADGQKGEDR